MKDNKALLESAKKNDSREVRKCLADGAIVSETTLRSWNAIHFLVNHGNLPCLRKVFKNDENKKVVNAIAGGVYYFSGGTALQIAMQNNQKHDEQIVERLIVLLLENEALLDNATRNAFGDVRLLFILIKQSALPLIKKFYLDEKRLVVFDSLGNTAMHQAAKAGDKMIAEYLYDRDKESLGVKNNNGDNPVHVAVANGNLAILEWFYQKCVDDWSNVFEEVDNNGNTVLHLATLNCREEIARWLISRGSIITSKNNNGDTSLMCALDDNRKLPVLKLLLEYSANLERHEEEIAEAIGLAKSYGTNISTKALKKNDEILKLLEEYSIALAVKIGADLPYYGNSIRLNDIRDSQGNNLLQIAIINRRERLIQEFMKTISILHSNAEGKTVFHLASEIGDLNTLRTLHEVIDREKERIEIASKEELEKILALPIKADKSGNTPLHYAAKKGRTRELIEYLLTCDYPADPKSLDLDGRKPLDVAAKEGNLITFVQLLRYADSRMVIESFKEACENGHIDVIRLILAENENNRKIKEFFNDINGKPLIFYIIGKNQLAVFNYLVEECTREEIRELVERPIKRNGSDVEFYASHYAAELGHDNFIGCLYDQSNEMLDKQDTNGETPLFYAIRAKKQISVKKLLSLNASLDVRNNNKQNPVDFADSDGVYRHISVTIRNYKLSFERNFSNMEKEDQEAFSYKNLVLEGGGIKGVAYFGVIEKLLENDAEFLNKIERIAGTSVGGISALLLSVGYPLLDAKRLVDQVNFISFLDSEHKDLILSTADKGLPSLFSAGNIPSLVSIFNVLTKELGLCPGVEIYKKIQGWIHSKTKDGNITFKELHNMRLMGESSYKDLYLTGVNASTQQTEIFSWEHTPDMIIADAVRISLSYPLVFKPWSFYEKNALNARIERAGALYIDGGVLDNYPISIFDRVKFLSAHFGKSRKEHVDDVLYNPETLGIKLSAKEDKSLADRHRQNDAGKRFPNYLMGLLACFYNKQNSDHMHSDDAKRTIYIDTGEISTFSFNLSQQQKKTLINSGKVAVDEFKRRVEVHGENFNVSPKALAFLITHCVKYHTSFGKWGLEIKDLSLSEMNPYDIYDLFNRLPDDSSLRRDDILVLKKLGINVDIKNKEGVSAIQLALKNANLDCIHRLKEAGSNIRGVGNICLDQAIEREETMHNALDILEFLLNNDIRDTKFLEKVTFGIVELLIRRRIKVDTVFKFFRYHDKDIEESYREKEMNYTRDNMNGVVEFTHIPAQIQCRFIIECIQKEMDIKFKYDKVATPFLKAPANYIENKVLGGMPILQIENDLKRDPIIEVVAVDKPVHAPGKNSFFAHREEKKAEQPKVLLCNDIEYIRNPVDPDGDCGYTAFGITRSAAYEFLTKNIDKVRDTLKSIVVEALLIEKFINYLPPNYEGIKDAYQKFIEAQMNCDPNLATFEDVLKRHADDLNLLIQYVNYDVKDGNIDAGWAHPVILQALAELQKINLYLFELDANNQMISHQVYPEYRVENAEQTVCLLFMNGNHFERLERLREITETMENRL